MQKGMLVSIVIAGILGYIVARLGATIAINLFIDLYSPEEEARIMMQLVASGVMAAIVAGSWYARKIVRFLIGQQSNQ